MGHVMRAATIQSLGAYLVQWNEKPGNLLRKIGVSPAALLDNNALLQRDAVLAMENQIARITGDPLLGFHTGQMFSMQQFEDWSARLLNQATLGDVLHYTCRNISQIESGTKISLRRKGRLAYLCSEMQGDIGHDPRYQLDGHCFILRSLLHLVGEPLDVLVKLPHVACQADDVECLLGAKVQFDSDTIELVFPWEALQTVLSGHIKAPPVPPKPFDDCLGVMKAIKATICYGRPTAEKSAATLGVNLRTMQRHLAAWGVTFEWLLDEYRRRTSVEFLNSGNLTITDIALGLGYSDSAHFTRAFRRWYGMPPNHWRARESGLSESIRLAATPACAAVANI